MLPRDVDALLNFVGNLKKEDETFKTFSEQLLSDDLEKAWQGENFEILQKYPSMQVVKSILKRLGSFDMEVEESNWTEVVQKAIVDANNVHDFPAPQKRRRKGPNAHEVYKNDIISPKRLKRFENEESKTIKETNANLPPATSENTIIENNKKQQGTPQEINPFIPKSTSKNENENFEKRKNVEKPKSKIFKNAFDKGDKKLSEENNVESLEQNESKVKMPINLENNCKIENLNFSFKSLADRIKNTIV